MTAESPGVRSHRATSRAGSFGSDADRYDRVRPGYPAVLVADLAPLGSERVLDVGCGTGKAAALFTARGCTVLGVDPDERMAGVARDRGLAVEVATFEAWEPAGRTFEIVTAAQAWHWVDPKLGPAKAANILEHGGLLAPIWNYRWPADLPQLERFRAIYEAIAPELLTSSPLLGTVDGESELAGYAAAITACGAFSEPATRRYRWEQRYSPDEWLDLARTQSDHRLIGEERLASLLQAVGDDLEAEGSSVPVIYESVALTARRR